LRLEKKKEEKYEKQIIEVQPAAEKKWKKMTPEIPKGEL